MITSFLVFASMTMAIIAVALHFLRKTVGARLVIASSGSEPHVDILKSLPLSHRWLIHVIAWSVLLALAVALGIFYHRSFYGLVPIGLMAGVVRGRSGRVDHSEKIESDGGREAYLFGHVIVPERIYVGDAFLAKLDLETHDERCPWGNEPTHTESGHSVELSIRDDAYHALEVELLAAAFEVRGDQKQQQNLEHEILSFQWNLHGKHSGKQALALVFRALTRGGQRHLSRIEHTVKVVQVFRLTARQVKNLILLSGGLAGLLGILTGLRELGLIW